MTLYSMSLGVGDYSSSMKIYLEGSERGKPGVYLPESDELNSFTACFKGAAIGGGFSLLSKGVTFAIGIYSAGVGAVAYCVHQLFRERQLSAQYASVPPRALTPHQKNIQLAQLANAFQIDIPEKEQYRILLQLGEIDTESQELENDMRRYCLSIYRSSVASFICGSSPEKAQEEIDARLAIIQRKIGSLDATLSRIKAGDKPA